MIIIGIDPATKCGWAVLKDGKRIASGTWDFSNRRHEGGGMRYLRCRKYFTELIDSMKPDAVAYEEIRRHMGVDAAHVYGGLVGQITAVCEDKKIPFKAIPVGTIKKTATGKGKASKQQMIDTANIEFSTEVVDDNEADALWIGKTLYNELS
jgi:Holliday junction resolvasome RuvABC endonuclease subunit